MWTPPTTSRTCERRATALSERTPKASSPDVAARMRRTGRRDTAAELAIRRQLHRRGLRYLVDERPSSLFRTRADILFSRWSIAIFVDGCFWHGCPDHSTEPKANATWWREKLAENMARDRRTDAALTVEGWEVVRIWEHEPVEEAVERIERALDRRRNFSLGDLN